MNSSEYNKEKQKNWSRYKDGDLTLNEYHDLAFAMLEQRLNEALADDKPIGGICMAAQFLRSECVREQLRPFWGEEFKRWMETEGPPAELLNRRIDND
jgi:hypothetical protein